MKTFTDCFKVIMTGDREASRQAARAVRKLLYSSKFDTAESKELKKLVSNAPAVYAKISEPWRQENFVVAISVLYYLHDHENQPDFLFAWFFDLLQHDRGNIRLAAVRMFQIEIGPLTSHLRFPDKQSSTDHPFTSEKADEILLELYMNLITLLGDVWKKTDRKYKYVHTLPSSTHKSVQQVLAFLIEYCGQKYVTQMEQQLKSSLPPGLKNQNNPIEAKQIPKNRHKLTLKDCNRLWGEDGPYSQVRLSEETRILDNSVSRVFLVVEAEINPFTFEYAQKHRQAFAHDEAVLQLLEHAEYRGPKFGYLVGTGETQLDGDESRQFAREQADQAIATLIRLHQFIMDEFNLKHNDDFGVPDDLPESKNQFAWNIANDTIGPLPNVWDEKNLIAAPAGIKANKMRLFVVLAFADDFKHDKKSAAAIIQGLKTASADCHADIEDIGTFAKHASITALLPLAIPPDNFIKGIISSGNRAAGQPIFKKDYLVTNGEKPTPQDIMAFLQQAE